MIKSFVLAFALAGAGVSPDASESVPPPVPEEIVFDVCRASWPDVTWIHGRMVDRNEGKFEHQADHWALNPAEREYVQTQCSDLAGKLLERYEKYSWKVEPFEKEGRLVPNRTFPERIH